VQCYSSKLVIVSIVLSLLHVFSHSFLKRTLKLDTKRKGIPATAQIGAIIPGFTPLGAQCTHKLQCQAFSKYIPDTNENRTRKAESQHRSKKQTPS
jgi:hypothetical protein